MGRVQRGRAPCARGKYVRPVLWGRAPWALRAVGHAHSAEGRYATCGGDRRPVLRDVRPVPRGHAPGAGQTGTPCGGAGHPEHPVPRGHAPSAGQTGTLGTQRRPDRHPVRRANASSAERACTLCGEDGHTAHPVQRTRCPPAAAAVSPGQAAAGRPQPSTSIRICCHLPARSQRRPAAPAPGQPRSPGLCLAPRPVSPALQGGCFPPAAPGGTSACPRAPQDPPPPAGKLPREPGQAQGELGWQGHPSREDTHRIKTSIRPGHLSQQGTHPASYPSHQGTHPARLSIPAGHPSCQNTHPTKTSIPPGCPSYRSTHLRRTPIHAINAPGHPARDQRTLRSGCPKHSSATSTLPLLIFGMKFHGVCNWAAWGQVQTQQTPGHSSAHGRGKTCFMCARFQHAVLNTTERVKTTDLQRTQAAGSQAGTQHWKKLIFW